MKNKISGVSASAVLQVAKSKVTAEQWWTRHAELLAVKMKLGGVKSFRIEQTEHGTYEFETVPVDADGPPTVTENTNTKN